MPTVQRYGQRQVLLAAIPGVRQQASVTAEALGAGTERAKAGAAGAMAEFGETAARIGFNEYAQIRQQAKTYQQDVQRMELQNQLSTWQRQRLFDPNGALNMKGKNAFGLPEQVGGEFDQYAAQLEAGIKDPEVRLAFQKMKLESGAQIDMTLRRHVLGEMQTYEAQQLQGVLDNSHNLAVLQASDEGAVTREVAKGTDAIRTSAKRLGQSDEAIADQVRKFQSATLGGVIEKRIDSDQVESAEELYEKSKKANLLDAQTVERIDKTLREGQVKVAGVKLADDIGADATFGTLAQQQAEVKRRTDAMKDQTRAVKIRDEANQRLEHQYNLQDRAKREHTEALSNSVYTRLEANGGDWSSVNAREKDELGSHLPALESYARSKSAGHEPVLNLSTYFGLKNMAANPDPKDRQTFMDTNLLGFVDQLPKGQLVELQDLQNRMRRADNAAPEVLAGIRSDQDMWNATMTEAGLDPKSDAANALHRQWGLEVDRAQASGTKISSSEKQELLDNLWQNIILKPGGYVPFLTGDEVSKKVSELTFADIPAEERKQAYEAVQKARPGVKITEGMVVKQYIYTKRKQGKGTGYRYVGPE